MASWRTTRLSRSTAVRSASTASVGPAVRDPMRRPENPGVGGSQIERLAYEEVMFAPIFELGFLVGVGPRLEELALGLIDHFSTPAPWEDVRLKRQ